MNGGEGKSGVLILKYIDKKKEDVRWRKEKG